MSIVSLCDKTGNMVRPWAEAGFECVCVDIQHSIRKDREERVGAGVIRYVWGDVRTWTPSFRPLIGFAFTPCTNVANSGARDFRKKGWAMLRDGLDLFHAAVFGFEWAGCPWMAENPAGRIAGIMGKSEYSFNPNDYGDPYTKETHIWCGGGFIMPPKIPEGDMLAAQTIVEPTDGSKMHKMPPSEDRANLRSATPMGFARAVFEANHRHVTSNQLQLT